MIWFSKYTLKEALMGRAKDLMIIVFIAVFFLSLSSLSYGFDEKQVQSLKKSNNCPKCDLSGANLANLDLTYADLSGANLTGADFSNTVLSNANLTNANLTNGNFTNVNFFEANLKGADITKADFTKAYFDQATWINGKRCAVGSIGACK
jgi:uncharacterized protein YjbI with pentapeptide repeats